jgi:hypothetical protein
MDRIYRIYPFGDSVVQYGGKTTDRGDRYIPRKETDRLVQTMKSGVFDDRS